MKAKYIALVLTLLASAAEADSSIAVAYTKAKAEGLLWKLPLQQQTAIFAAIPTQVTVEYVVPEKAAIPATYTPAQRRERLRSLYNSKSIEVIQRLQTTFSVAFVNRRELLPLVIFQVNTRDGLLSVLRDSGVSNVAPTSALATQLGESAPLVNQPLAVTMGASATGVNVAVIDTGINPNRYPYTAGRVVSSIDFTGYNNPWDSNGHGTLIADIIAHMAPGVNIISMKAGGVDPSQAPTPGSTQFSMGPRASSTAVQAAIEWLLVSADTNNVRVANFSLASAQYWLGDCTSSVYSHLMTDLVDFNIVPVVAAGNGMVKSALPEPACARDAYTVGATYDVASPLWYQGANGRECTDRNVLPGSVACFSDSSISLDAYAPGCYVDTQTNLYSVGNPIGHCGTSLAAAVTSGAVALVRGELTFYPLNARQVVDALRAQTTHYVTDPANGMRRPLLDTAAVLAAVRLTGSRTDATGTPQPAPPLAPYVPSPLPVSGYVKGAPPATSYGGPCDCAAQ